MRFRFSEANRLTVHLAEAGNAEAHYDEFLNDRVRASWSVGDSSNWESAAQTVKSRFQQLVNCARAGQVRLVGEAAIETTMSLHVKTFVTNLSESLR